jgi:hypothetical protein
MGIDTVHTLSKTWAVGALFGAGDSGMGEEPERKTGQNRNTY